MYVHGERSAVCCSTPSAGAALLCLAVAGCAWLQLAMPGCSWTAEGQVSCRVTMIACLVLVSDPLHCWWLLADRLCTNCAGCTP